MYSKSLEPGKIITYYKKICDRLNRRLAHLATLPETRMANYKRVVFRNFLRNFHPIVLGLEEIQIEKCKGNARDREDADACAVLRGKIFNKEFLMRTTGVCDRFMGQY